MGVVFPETVKELVSVVKFLYQKKISFIAAIGISAFGIILLPMIIPILFPKFIETTIAIQILSLTIIPATVGTFYESKLLSLEKGKLLISKL